MSKSNDLKLAKEAKAKGVIVKVIPFGDRKCYLSEPDRKTMGLAMTRSRKNPLAMAEVVIANCWISGDDSLKKDVGFLTSLSGTVDSLIGAKEIEVENL